MIAQWLYFGCGTGSGHYLFTEGRASWRAKDERLEYFDGKLAPQRPAHRYVAAFSILGGQQLAALSWWDNSVDHRPGSNSIIFAPLNEAGAPEAMLEEAQRRFPWVFSRLPQPVRLFSEADAISHLLEKAKAK